jgi:hypothetical protein
MHRDEHDSTEPIGELRWRAYLDHLEDLGYDLEGGTDGGDHATTRADMPSGGSSSLSARAAG